MRVKAGALPRAAWGAVLLVVSLLLLNGVTQKANAAVPTATSADQVTVDTGALKGTVNSDHRRFLGIPYAAPPTGERRFRPPQPASSWSGVRDATRSGSACAQSLPIVQTLIPSSEDCLTVDVYTPPASAGTNLPVMVWFYGGAYLLGSNAGYDPTPLVTKGKVIVVEVNYRLGPFGFLSLPALDRESTTGTSGNMAFADQQAGLRWVQRNIAAFGGDKNNVTIFGESAGGNSVCHQVASPQAAGLFHRAIVQSGACSGRNGLTAVSKAESQARSRAYAAELGCADPATELACLRALPQNKLLSSPSVRLEQMELGWGPSVDGHILPRSLDEIWRSGSYNKVPLMVGGTRDEARTFVALFDHVMTFSSVTAEEYTTSVREQFGSDADKVLAKYPVSAFTSPDLAKGAVLTDSSFSCPTVWHVARSQASGSRVFTYELNDVDPPMAFLDPFMPLGNYHMVDMFYLFAKVEGVPVILNSTQTKLSNQMIAAWTTFARTGSPGAVGGTAWPAWTPGQPNTLELNSAGNKLLTNVPATHNCDFWTPLVG